MTDASLFSQLVLSPFLWSSSTGNCKSDDDHAGCFTNIADGFWVWLWFSAPLPRLLPGTAKQSLKVGPDFTTIAQATVVTSGSTRLGIGMDMIRMTIPMISSKRHRFKQSEILQITLEAKKHPLSIWNLRNDQTFKTSLTNWIFNF